MPSIFNILKAKVRECYNDALQDDDKQIVKQVEGANELYFIDRSIIF